VTGHAVVTSPRIKKVVKKTPVVKEVAPSAPWTAKKISNKAFKNLIKPKDITELKGFTMAKPLLKQIIKAAAIILGHDIFAAGNKKPL